MKEAAPREGVKFGVRRLAWYAGGFSGGVYLAQYLLTGPWLLWAGLMSLALGVLTLFLPLDGSAGVVRRRSVILCAALAAGLGWSWLYVRQAQRPAEELTGWTGPIEAEALDYPTKNDYTTRVLVRLEGVRAYLYGVPMDVTPGQRIMGTAELRDASRIREDDITTFTSKGVFLLAYGKGALTIEQGTSGSPRWYPLRLGRAMQGKLSALFPEDTAGVLAALLTGERSLIPETVSADFNEAGLSHVLAVSGMHCGVLLAFLTRLTGKGRGRVWTALPILVFYALLTGCRPSVVRACVMIGFLLIGPLFRRESDPPTALLTALMLILAQNPFAAASAGLQLSFASVAGLLWLTPKLNAGLPKGVRKPKTFRDCLLWLLRKILQSFCVTAGALVFTIPLMAWRFGTIAIIAPLSNLLCLPAVWALFCLGLMSAAAGLVFFPLGGLLAIPAEYLCRWILLVSGWLARIPGHAVYLNNPFLKYWLLYTYALFAAACLFRGTPRRRYALAGALACLTLVLTVRLGAARYRSDLDILMLDVGQGQSVALASGGHFALVDCGSANGCRVETAPDHGLRRAGGPDTHPQRQRPRVRRPKAPGTDGGKTAASVWEGRLGGDTRRGAEIWRAGGSSDGKAGDGAGPKQADGISACDFRGGQRQRSERAGGGGRKGIPADGRHERGGGETSAGDLGPAGYRRLRGGASRVEVFQLRRIFDGSAPRDRLHQRGEQFLRPPRRGDPGAAGRAWLRGFPDGPGGYHTSVMEQGGSIW